MKYARYDIIRQEKEVNENRGRLGRKRLQGKIRKRGNRLKKNTSPEA